MQRVGLSIQPEHFNKLLEKLNFETMGITEVKHQEHVTDKSLWLLEELLGTTYQKTQQILAQYQEPL